MAKARQPIPTVAQLRKMNGAGKLEDLIKPAQGEVCRCGNKVETMSFKGTGYCSQKCQKEYKGDPVSVRLIDQRLQDAIVELQAVANAYAKDKSVRAQDYGAGIQHALDWIDTKVFNKKWPHPDFPPKEQADA